MKRLENEPFEEYRMRRKRKQFVLKLYKRGQVIWNSKIVGTYIKSKHGPIGNVYF